MPNIDWTKVKTEYVTGDESLRDIAKRIGAQLSTVGRQSAMGNWAKERNKFRTNSARKTVEKVTKNHVDSVAEAARNLMSFAIQSSKIINDSMKDDSTLHNYIVGSSDGPREYRLDKIDARALNQIASASANLAKMLKTLYPDENMESENENSVLIMPDREED
jgi:hypothetical protein